jgi:transglutaminase-like putative cysteine protease
MMGRVLRTVRSRLEFDVEEPAWAALQIAVAGPTASETLTVTSTGGPVTVRELAGPHGGRLHVLDAPVGRAVVEYDATVAERTPAAPATEMDRLTYLRPSRYAESDRMNGFAFVEFQGVPHGAELLAAVSSWVGMRLAYVPGSSEPTDGATETLLSGAGVCRDYAHLVVAILRALDVPARLVAVYAPGLDPMDFHAVAEAWVDDAWCVVDSTLLAPRSSLVRIATGRDAADTAFLSTYGDVDLVSVEVVAYTDGDLPTDDVTQPVVIG